MALYAFDGKTPTVGKDCYIADSAEVIGDVTLGDGCYVGPGAILRGDYGRVAIGDGTAIEEGAIVHARPGDVATAGAHVTLGHGAIVHTAKRIDDFAVIGMGAIISDWAVIGRWAVVGEGAVVRNRQEIPPEAIAVGVPAKVIGSVDEEYKKTWMHFKNVYVELAKTYRSRIERLEPISR